MTKEYGLVWDREKEPEKVVLDCENKKPILIEIPEKKITNNKEYPYNILIEEKLLMDIIKTEK